MNIENLYQEEVYMQSVHNRFKKHNIDPDLTSKILTLLSGEEVFQPKQFESYTLEEVFKYLQISHDYYLNVCIPQIENSLAQLMNKSTGNNSSVKLYFLLLNNYKNELIDHIEKEENVLFKYVQRKLEGQEPKEGENYAISYFLNSHNDNVILEIDKLKADMLHQNNALQSEFSFDILFRQLSILQKDLTIHGLIEDHVFIPILLRQMRSY